MFGSQKIRNRGRPKNDRFLRSFDTPSKENHQDNKVHGHQEQLRCRNYDNQNDDDSIDIQDIVELVQHMHSQTKWSLDEQQQEMFHSNFAPSQSFIVKLQTYNLQHQEPNHPTKQQHDIEQGQGVHCRQLYQKQSCKRQEILQHQTLEMECIKQQDEIYPQSKTQEHYMEYTEQEQRHYKREVNESTCIKQQDMKHQPQIIKDQAKIQIQMPIVDIKQESDDNEQSSKFIKTRSKQSREQRHSKPHHHMVESYSKQTIEHIISEFKDQKEENTAIHIAQLCQKYKITQSSLMSMRKEWLIDPTLSKYSQIDEQLIDGLRERTIQRIKQVKQIIRHNPYLSQNDLSTKLFDLDRSKKKLLRSAIFRLLNLAGFSKKKAAQNYINQATKLKLSSERATFALQYKEYERLNGKFFYLDEFLFHKYLYYDSFWTLNEKEERPVLTQKFISEGIILIALLTPDGNLYWEMRNGNYNNQEYSEVIQKIVKKMGKFQNEVIIVNQNPIRNISLTMKLIQKTKAKILKLPPNSQHLSPLQSFFKIMKQNVRSSFTKDTSQQLINGISVAIYDTAKQEYTELIDRCKVYIDMISKGQVL